MNKVIRTIFGPSKWPKRRTKLQFTECSVYFTYYSYCAWMRNTQQVTYARLSVCGPTRRHITFTLQKQLVGLRLWTLFS